MKETKENGKKGGVSLPVKQIRFGQTIKGGLKKRDRYKEIFGEKPKYLLLKVGK